MIHSPLLAADLSDWNFDFERIPFPVLATPKIDGIRCVIGLRDGHKQALSRTLKAIPNYHIFAQLVAGCPLNCDGELVVPGGFQITTSTVMSHISLTQVDFRYQVFDILSEKPYRERCIDLALANLPDFCDKVIPKQIDTVEQLVGYETACLAEGYEGVMLRAPNGPHLASLGKTNRATLKRFTLVKLKRYTTDEATVTGFEPLLHNANAATTDERGLTKRSHSMVGLMPLPKLGALVVTHPIFGSFNIGTGFTDAQRNDYWNRSESLLGATVTFKYLPHGTKDKPRHPVFKGFRHVDDL